MSATGHGDRYAGEWPREQFRRHGIGYEVATKSKSDLYVAFLPLLTSQMVELVDQPRLIQQIVGLERRTARGGGTASTMRRMVTTISPTLLRV